MIKEAVEIWQLTVSRMSCTNCQMQAPLSLLAIKLWQHSFKSKFRNFFLIHFSRILLPSPHQGSEKALLHIHVNIQHILANPSGFYQMLKFSINFNNQPFFCWLLLTSSFYSWIQGFHILFPLLLYVGTFFFLFAWIVPEFYWREFFFSFTKFLTITQTQEFIVSECCLLPISSQTIEATQFKMNFRIKQHSKLQLNMCQTLQCTFLVKDVLCKIRKRLRTPSHRSTTLLLYCSPS